MLPPLAIQQSSSWIDKANLKIHVPNHFRLADAVKAHQLLESGSITGKIILVICDE
ncbi:MAG: zinc-binding dehydrogenase [Cyanomargarita calcarea GSE-NOS-MK-12-04C]|uniref:Zinc-binding dehydrogenase n=1 Tax=Cyanomargarita calcarea GSE-NOS-MK-12-04C TaxID=2839659 RepID=A0A951QIZ4_9CYAN|nr:zinc-binding dehydrogenase [Cyanomargarita calcarea GSE-NOS-MK-12-04C]